MQFHRRKKVQTLLNIAPLIDCVFLLLIFFLLTSSFIEEVGLEIELPESASASTVEEQEIVISLSEEGHLEINGKPSSLDRLQEDVSELINRWGKNQAILRADKNVRLELLIKVMDLIKAAGIKAINIKTIPAPQ
ncbi:MAG: biopolymer transporter ExbD [Planctomycetota bacterium]|nr:biopolymer transporter ExbD [Planctomycetota bacterium]MDI6787069.1 biopolymer transporter ExbD [Planctomycetota bacterium]